MGLLSLRKQGSSVVFSLFRRQESALPGFGITLGVTILWLSLIVLIPLSMIFVTVSPLSPGELWATVTTPRSLAAFRLTFAASFLAALANVFIGFVVAWVLVRYDFPGRRLLDSLVDLPFALPTAVAGIALTAVYAKTGWIGSLIEPMGIRIAFAPPGVFLALLFLGFPFVVRTLQPPLEDLDPEFEEAAVTLGASRLLTIWKIMLPALAPSLLTGFSLAFARGLGEYGSIIFISGNLPMRTEIVPLLIMTKLEGYDYVGAAALALVMLIASFVLLFAINLIPVAFRMIQGRGK